MKMPSTLLVLACLTGLLNTVVVAQSAQEPEMEAKLALERFLQAWNTANNSAIQKEVNYPHVTHAPFGLVIANEEANFVTDFQELKKQGWSSSRFDRITRGQSSEEKVNFAVEYSRLNARGEVYSRGYVFYVVTRQNGHWGMQYRAPGAVVGENSAEQNIAREEALAAVDDFFVAFNAADNSALLNSNHVPQVMMNGGRFIYAKTTNSGIVSMNFQRLRESENWNSSAMTDLQLVNVTANQVIIELSFERFNSDEEKYLTVPALWVLAKRNNKWGVEFRSLMPPIQHSL